MQLPAGATGFFEAGTFREPIQRGEFSTAGLSAGPREPVHRGRNRHFIMREKLLCRTNRPKQWNRNSVHERIYRPSGLFRLLGSTAAPIYSALSCAGRPASAESAALPLVTGTIGTNVVLLDALAPAEQEQLRYWQPNTIGEILFNFWD